MDPRKNIQLVLEEGVQKELHKNINRTVLQNKRNTTKIDSAAGGSDGLDLAFNDDQKDKIRFKKMFVRLEPETGNNTSRPVSGLDGTGESVNIVGG